MFNMPPSLPHFRPPREFPTRSAADIGAAGPGILPRPHRSTEVGNSSQDTTKHETNLNSPPPFRFSRYFTSEAAFDDVQKTPMLPSKEPKELKEWDENKSTKGLAKIYEEEYAQNTGLVSTTLSFSDEQKQEARLLFIEDMLIQTKVPALAMEKIAPKAVSDAVILAPREVFVGTGDINEEIELTKAARKRRRLNQIMRAGIG